MGFDSKHDFSPPTVLLGLIFCPWMWGVSSQSLQRLRAAAPAPHSHCTTPAQPPLQRHQLPLHHCTATSAASPATSPPLHSHHSSIYHLAGASLPLDVGYLLTVTPAPCNHNCTSPGHLTLHNCN